MSALRKGSALPVELERLIFELCAGLHPRMSPSLILVAHRVKIWIEPLLYKVLMHSGMTAESPTNARARRSVDALRQLLRQPRATFSWPNHVRHICLSDLQPWGMLMQLLSLCKNTTNLALLYPTPDLCLAPRFPALLGSLRLQRISIHLNTLFPPSAGAVDFSHSMFTHLTHLDLRDYDLRNRDGGAHWSGIGALSRLTHLSFRRSHVMPVICEVALRKCAALRVLVSIIRIGTWTPTTRPSHEEDRLARRDVRFVMILLLDYQLDWEIGAWGGDDYWTVAEARVKERREKSRVEGATQSPYFQEYIVL
ncbi:hypothetical protein C8R46DRAFT_1343090 [Mycena filopes]|nr:hypothetical protein C8R46DRAFT_1343090 [Mycena filopes]